MKRCTVFCFKSFNDIDHISPLLWYSIRNHNPVIVIFYGKQNIEKFTVLSNIIKLYGIKYYQINTLGRIKKYFFWNLISCFIFLKFHKVERIIFDWFVPKFREFKGQLFYAAKLNGTKTYALPHGYFIYKNYDFNEKVKKEKNVLSFKKRNSINKYYLNNNYQRNFCIKKGLNKEIIEINGNMRFSRLWHKEMKKHYFKETTEKSKILFFTPHWTYNVNKEKTLSLLDKLIQIYSSDVLKISLHTRGSGGLEYKKYDKYILSNNKLSGESIMNSEIIICFGSSIVFEAILQKKLIINPSYLHSNSTIYDDYESLNNTKNENDTINKIEELLSGNHKNLDKEYNEIIKKYIYLNKNEEPIISFYNQIFKEIL